MRGRSSGLASTDVSAAIGTTELTSETNTMPNPLRSIAPVLISYALCVSPALADPQQDYVTLMTAIQIDRSCGALQYMELDAVRAATSDYLAATPQYRQKGDGLLSAADYQAWRSELDRTADENASAAACGQEALAYVLAAKSLAAARLYQGLMLAFHFDALPEDDRSRIPLDQYQKTSAAEYEQYLGQLYGENFTDFAERQRQVAAAALPAANAETLQKYHSTYSPFDPEGNAKLRVAQDVARATMNLVQFEVTAQANGYQLRPRQLANGGIVPALVSRQMPDGLPVIHGPGYQELETADGAFLELYHVIAVLPDRRLRIMFYGDTAAQWVIDPTVRLYVNDGAPATDGMFFFSTPEFRNGAASFDATAVSEPCLGATCFDLPPEATEMMVSAQEGNVAELFVSLEPEALPVPVGEEIAVRNAVSNGRLRAILN